MSLIKNKYFFGTRTKSVSRLPDKIINKRAAFTNSINIIGVPEKVKKAISEGDYYKAYTLMFAESAK